MDSGLAWIHRGSAVWGVIPIYEKGPLSRENGVAETSIGPEGEGAFSMPSSPSPAGLLAVFDDDHAVANAGLLPPATLAQRLGIEAVIDELVDLGDRPGAHRPGRKVLTLVQPMLAGADCIDDADVLCTGQTARVLGHRVMAPPPSARSCAASPSATSASWTASLRPSWLRHGRPALGRAMRQ